ncbi:MerR family transcriptional regulator [Paenibacillus sp. J5C_2022]|uniref:MerR family transcriptional regulator n=1 Tax=Paenibacillus sp. J5C2022 TaxID=2977129 RepID=UPI0021D3930C|nr:MerR family transcriptional regulator [Paenibacillus sp. J5C2022]MCU6712137.1 MerR family transcriptional regulator [Paenibacillus sp. J5C2022]
MTDLHTEKTYSIGEVAKLIGSTIKTVRYYDEIGLVKPAGYTEGGHRLYTTEDIWRLELTTTLRYLDFGIDDIRQIISGEVPVDKALDWQIESLEIQASTLNNMISILRDAKKRKGDSLQHIYDLVHARTINTEKRKQFLSEKVEETRLFEHFPTEWKDPLLFFFNKYVVQQPKESARQTAAWQELQELMNDPQFVADLKEVESKFAHVVQQPRDRAGVWTKKLEAIQERLNHAWKEQYAPGSKAVQSIVDDMVRLYASSEEQGAQEEFFYRFAEYCESTQTEHLERCNTLCAIISPQYHQLYRGNSLLYQGVQWRLQRQ